jgi:hypothetical protein
VSWVDVELETVFIEVIRSIRNCTCKVRAEIGAPCVINFIELVGEDERSSGCACRKRQSEIH